MAFLSAFGMPLDDDGDQWPEAELAAELSGATYAGAGVHHLQFPVTLFWSYAATEKREEHHTLSSLAELIAKQTARTKDALPWLKLAQFGGAKTKQGNLRHNDNVLMITGVEADYDAERMTVSEAVETLEKAGVLAMVYTSPSHTEDKPRWRVLCPTSRAFEPELRDAFLARLNGLFGGVFSGESWTLSQAYYYGSVKSSPSHSVHVIDGTPIDEHTEMDAGRIGKTAETGAAGPATAPSTSGAGLQAASSMDVVAALTVIPNDQPADWNFWNRVGMATWAATGGSIAGFAAWAAWSGKHPDYDAAETSNRWSHYATSPPTQIGAGTLFHMAREARPLSVRPSLRGVPSPSDDQAYGGHDIEEIIAEFNEQYMVVSEAGKVVVYEPRQDPILKRQHFIRYAFEDFKRLHMDLRVLVGKEYKPAADIWLRSPARRAYKRGIIFDPSTTEPEPGTLNLWGGFAVEPKPGDWSLMRAHIRDVICNGDEASDRYLTGWIANMLQHPDRQGEVAVVVKGGEGVGKGILGHSLRRMLGQHGMHINNSKYLVGNFNAHLRDCIFLFADEAFFAGDKAALGTLKALITEETIQIEAKGRDAVQQPNYLHVLMASNEKWVVPASLDSRRFFVLEVSDSKQRNRPYFKAIADQMANGGDAAMLNDMLVYDTSDFDVRDFPVTTALQDQRKRSLPAEDAWWLDVLERGHVFQSRLGLEDTFGEWSEQVTTELLHKSYMEFARTHHERRTMTREDLGRFMVRVGPQKPPRTSRRWRNAIIGERAGSEVLTKPLGCGYYLGSLAQARADFCAAAGLSHDWPD